MRMVEAYEGKTLTEGSEVHKDTDRGSKET